MVWRRGVRTLGIVAIYYFSIIYTTDELLDHFGLLKRRILVVKEAAGAWVMGGKGSSIFYHLLFVIRYRACRLQVSSTNTW